MSDPSNDPNGPQYTVPRRRKYPTSRRRLIGLAVSVACTVTIVILAAPWLLFIPFVYDHQPMWPSGSATFTMVGSTAKGIDVPNCALVSVSWTDLAGQEIGFGSNQGGAAILVSSCTDTAIPLAAATPPYHCRPAWCNSSGASTGGMYGTYQVGRAGTFQFVDTQGAFGFWADAIGTNSLSSDPVSIHYSYSVAVFSVGVPPPGDASPAFSPHEWIFLVPVVVAVWFFSVRFLKKEQR